ncbi:hypothetical protein [Stenotrophomonas phage vB_SmeS_BUCT704]|nr:hypothetical protein [Stenotrophomonas phage vB_SmeS_BUCT702]UUG68395.1 hypothetical protein [Stenotrophomonas phage vB_SmeS_BUCT704]
MHIAKEQYYNNDILITLINQMKKAIKLAIYPKIYQYIPVEMSNETKQFLNYQNIYKNWFYKNLKAIRFVNLINIRTKKG